MINKNVVFILGAGASKPYKFPLGSELRDYVIKYDAPGKELLDVLTFIGSSKSDFDKFRHELRKSLAPSIDAFLERHDEFMLLGKTVIAFMLMLYESEANLYSARDDENWYRYLYSEMMRPSDIDNFSSNKLGFITYNYDRSLEYCLFNALKTGWAGVSDKAAAEALKKVPIVHMYGQLGELIELNSTGRPYGTNLEPSNVLIARNGITIVHEGIDDGQIFSEAHDLIASAELIVFFGFGYNRRNLERLQLRKFKKQNASCIDLPPKNWSR